jgi:hypothetical protein
MKKISIYGKKVDDKTKNIMSPSAHPQIKLNYSFRCEI